ncbi:hypothetical protein [Sphingobium sp. CFD-2]|uniref:DUF7940 domain-containing protein n=1 Tax=Sphingobium sp. CFD-2 TaxID=2878542 RepID=UPI00214B7770|nr:hypothetical protein [Sphingobium sp. CFD-2]
MRPIDEWRSWWRMSSVRISAVATAVWAYLLANPETLNQVLASIPPDLRDLVAPAAPVAIFVLVTIARVTKQEPPDARK